MRSSPSALRSEETWSWTILCAVSGRRPSQSSSIRYSVDTAWPRASNSSASTERGFAPPSGTCRSPSRTSSRPRIRNSTVFPVSPGTTVHPLKAQVYTAAWPISTPRFTAPHDAPRVRQAAPARFLFLVGIATVALVTATATTAVAAAPRPLPTAGETPLLGGDYATSRFAAPFSFSVRERDDWRVAQVTRQQITLGRGAACCGQNAGQTTGVLMVMRPGRVIDPRTGKATRVPRNLARWIRRNPHLRTGQVSGLRVGTRRARVFGIGFRSATPRSEGCAGVLELSFGRFGLCPGERGRLAVVEGGARPLLFHWSTGMARALARLERPVRRLLGTVRFGKRRVGTRPRVLVIGNSDPTSDAELFFARKAARLSDGTLQISLRSELYGERPDKERRVARDLQAGRLPLAWDATRVWDTEGVTSFQGLQAPFLVDSVGLMDRVIRSPLVAQVASGLGAKGVTGLGLAAINLRRPLGARKAFTSVAAFQGAKVNVVTSRISQDVLRALGAAPVDVGGGDVLGNALRRR